MFVCLISTQLAHAQNYSVTNLGSSSSYVSAEGINASGQVIFVSGYRGFFFNGASSLDIGTLGGTQVGPNGINASGQVVGRSYTTGNAAQHAFSWTQAGGMVDLGTLGGTYSYARGINASGQVMGFAYTAGNAAYRAFSWTQAGGMVDLGAFGGTYSYATGINASGQVVGWAYTGIGAHAFSWTQAGGMVDLNAHIPSAPAGMVLYAAQAISDNGSIAAHGNTGAVLLGSGSTAPVVGPIAANDPVAVGAQLALSAAFTGVDTADTHTAQWTWGDATGESGSVSEAGGSGTASGTHVFSAAGIYTVGVSVTDSTGRTAQVSRDIVVYDPAAGFVTGGGWINSPVGAYKADQTLVGRATFGFVSKYQKGATRPSGKTEFNFHAAKLDFHSENYDWLVVAGARAQYKGTGTINGAGSYKFMLTAIDGAVSGGGGVDRFRIKIWHYDATLDADVVDYDNQTDTSTEGTLTEGTVIGGGSIVIYKK